MTIYTHRNCMPKTAVIDEASGEPLEFVAIVDTDARAVTEYVHPLQVVPATDDIMTVTRLFESVDIEHDKTTFRPCKFTLHGLESVA